MKLSTETSVVIPNPRGEVFDFCTDDENTARTLRPLGPIAGVTKVEMHEGQSLETGAHRTITMTDGVTLEEEILDYTRPIRHQYRWVGDIKPPFAWLVRSGTGCWEFLEVSGGTRVVWSYVFELRSALAYPLALPIISLFKRWMAQGLGAIAAEIAQQSTAAPQPPADQATAQDARPR
jgi:hypothetical protein